MYGICFFLNSLWYYEISKQFNNQNSTDSSDQNKKVQKNASISRYSIIQSKQKTKNFLLYRTISTEIYRFILLMIYLIQTTIVYPIPFVGPIISFILLAWLSSYYAFEYQWMHHGLDLHERIYKVEQNWCYFIGFGTPIGVLTGFFEGWIAQGVFSLFFPMVYFT